MLANAGADVDLLMSVFGWSDPRMALHYIRRRNRFSSAARAVAMFDAVVEAEAA